MYRVTNEQKFHSKVVVVDIDIQTFVDAEMKSFIGTVSIETVNEGNKTITGEHGIKDYEDEYGFVVDNE